MEEIKIKIEYKDTFERDHLKNRKKVFVRENFIEDSCKNVQDLKRESTSSTSEVPLYEHSPPRGPAPPKNTKRRMEEASKRRHLLEEPSCSTVGADHSSSPPSKSSPSSQSSDTDDQDGVVDYKESYLTKRPTWYRYINHYGWMQCRFCDRKYKVLSTLQVHVRRNHPKEAIYLRKASEKSKRRPRIFCRLCLTTFDTLDMLKNHITKHQLIRNHKLICDYCKADFTSKYEIINHIKISHMDSEGNFIKMNKRKLVGKTNADMRYQCPYCVYISKRCHTLTRHMKVKHTTEDDLIFHCPFCQYRAPLKYYLESHIVSKHPKSNYAKSKPRHVCDICGYSTVKKSHYILHRQQHFPDKKYKCDFCEYETIFLASLTDHRRIHTKEKPFSCDVEGCNFTCSAKTNYNNHKLRHDPNRPVWLWYCDLCTYKTLYKSTLNKHIAAHSRNSQRIGLRAKY